MSVDVTIDQSQRVQLNSMSFEKYLNQHIWVSNMNTVSDTVQIKNYRQGNIWPDCVRISVDNQADRPKQICLKSLDSGT